ncbi:hypothetical protein Pyn_40474 [Prunus yedoensis var. nudiflora]|uniref:Uncharacterized protein n=1 Tax=Prunus yedoensis var. nudiflora TaxID=2094558 RepID=A0A314Y3B5_PRUYE|nr:hypothetical protein Pyn_40474 [Prunus yedoensis var. nudiflora]
MERRNNNKSTASVASAVEDVEDKVLMRMASRQDELHDKLSEIQEALAIITSSHQTQLTMVTEELRLLRSVLVLVLDPVVQTPRGACTNDGEVDDDLGREGVTHEPPLLQPLAKFSHNYFLQSARISSKLYLLQQDGPDKHSGSSSARSFGGYVFDMETRSLSPSIPPTISSKPEATVVSAYGKLYYLPSPYIPIYAYHPGFEKYDPDHEHWESVPPDPRFEKYDPEHEHWESLPPFPFYNDELYNTEITGYAVCYGFICFRWATSRSTNPKSLLFMRAEREKNGIK